MVKALGILTAIILALAIFVAYKNKIAYEKEIADTGNETYRTDEYKVGLKADPFIPKTQFPNEKSRLGYNQGRLERARTDLADTIAKRKGVDEENVKLGEEEFAQTKTNEGLKAQIATKTAKIAENKAKLDDIRERTSKVGDIKTLAAKMKVLKAEIEELAQNIAANEGKLANLNNENTQTEAHIKSLKDKFETISQNRSLPTMKTRIRSIYPTWGFVTLASGNDAGVVTGSTLDVMRGDDLVAKLLVTAVERNSASASIIPDSLAQDTVLMVGDRVIPTQKAGDRVPPPQKAAAQPAQN
ncbi:MAG: hypothetical protein WCS43_11750 [Verrucomicrobiota bacterium]